MGKIKKQRKKKRAGGKIAFTLTGAFLVPVILLIVSGILSYKTASSYTVRQYEDSVTASVGTVTDYYDLLCSTIENKVSEVSTNDSVVSYYSAYAGNMDTEAANLQRQVQNILTAAKGSCTYAYSYNVIASNGGNMTSLSKNLPADAYQGYIASGEAEIVNQSQRAWLGYHSYLDGVLGIAEDAYGLCYTKKLTEGEGYIVFDIAYNQIVDKLSAISQSEGSIAAIVTQDGREIFAGDGSTNTDGEKVFFQEEFYEKALTEGTAGSRYIEKNGEKYLFTYSPAGKRGLMICSLIPSSTIMASASGIRNVTIMTAVAAGIIALIIGLFIAGRISRELKGLAVSMHKVSAGDFTTEFKSSRRDEFKKLSLEMTDMLGNIRHMASEMKGFCSDVNVSAGGVSSATASMADSMNSINLAMDEVAKGVAQQAQDTEKSLSSMSDFSDKLNELADDTGRMEKSSESAMKAVETGKAQIAGLNEKSAAASEVTQLLVKDISEVDAHSSDIGSIVETINAIADQTNLLSLNASIEAARAGDAGKGFAVVAEEIRNLAEQSSAAGRQIAGIIGTIQQKTGETAECADKAKDFLKEQSDSIEGTIEVFRNIASDVEAMVGILNIVSQNMSEMMSSRRMVMDSIESIASVSQETAAAAQEVTATVNTQLDAAVGLAKEAARLSQEVTGVNDTMNKYIV